jgi:hypothetical protein
MNLKNSPLSRTPPSNVPSHLLKGEPTARCMNPNVHNGTKPRVQQFTKTSPAKPTDDHDDQFDMDL